MFDDLTPPARRKEVCPMMEKAIKELGTEDLQKLITAMDDSRWTNNSLAEALTKQGFEISETKLWKHRAKRCACARES